jgi:hypothetical protein
VVIAIIKKYNLKKEEEEERGAKEKMRESSQSQRML